MSSSSTRLAQIVANWQVAGSDADAGDGAGSGAGTGPDVRPTATRQAMSSYSSLEFNLNIFQIKGMFQHKSEIGDKMFSHSNVCFKFSNSRNLK